MPTETERAYLAGLIDGEGHIGITLAKQADASRRWHTHVVILTLANTHMETLAWVQGLWPRCTLGMKRSALSPVPTGHLRWSSASAASVLRDIVPFLRIKRAQALLAIQFADGIAEREYRSRFITPGEWDRREELRVAIRQINRPDPTVVVQPYPEAAQARHEKVCAHCGQSFTDELRTNRKFCTPHCQSAAAWQRFKARQTTTP